MYSHGSYDPAVHGEDRGSYADPQVVKNISGIFQASKEAWGQEEKERGQEKKAREEELIQAKISHIKRGARSIQT